jgi:hypothetical protein
MSDINSIDGLLGKMWNDYIALNPQAQKIVKLIESTGDKVTNDHIALRTFNHPSVNVDVIAKPFIESGYVFGGDYDFVEKKLKAKHFTHPDKNMPLIFISELLLEKFSPEFNEIVNKLVDQVESKTVSAYDFSSMGRPWNITSDEYQSLKNESDYGSWVGAIGYRPNHFTVSINELTTNNDIYKLNEFLKDNGIKLNTSGGEVKGSVEVCLMQSSTLADNVEVSFSDKSLVIPSCYFEFAKRFPMENGELYRGFVAKSADKIFESTDKTQS